MAEYIAPVRAGQNWRRATFSNKYRRLTYNENGAWGLRGAKLAQCPPSIYGACAKLCDMESLCEEAAAQYDGEDLLYLLQELIDKGLGGQFVRLGDFLEVKKP